MNLSDELRKAEELYWAERGGQYKYAYMIWLFYEYQCEKYDRHVCSSFDEYGFAIPTTNEELIMINKNVLDYMRFMHIQKKTFRIKDDMWDQARRHVNMLTWQGLKSEYLRHYHK